MGTEIKNGIAITHLKPVEGGGGEPSAYIKDASVSQDGNTLTLTKKNNTTVSFSPTGGSVLITSESDVVVQGYAVPALTAEQITAAYNAVVTGKACVILDRNEIGHFFVNQADSLNGDITIEILFYNSMLVTYTVSDDVVYVDGKVLEGSERHPYISLERLRAYLYRVTFDSLPEDNGGDGPVVGGCSAYVKDGKLYRNLDFRYDNAASFIVRTHDFEGMSFLTGLDDGAMNDSLIAQLPYRVVDGRNNNGIMVSTHVLFNDWQWTGCGNKSIPLTRLPFLVLTRVKSMATIATDLSDIISNLSSTEGLDAAGYLLQILVTDGTTTYALLPPDSDNQSYVIQDITANAKLTNFRWLSSSTVERDDADIQTRPTGIERFNAMPCPLSELRFTKAYEAPTRLSEFIGIDDTDKDSTDEELEEIYDIAHARYLDRERDGETWQTMHSVVYGDKMEELYIQEDWSDNCIYGDITSETYIPEEPTVEIPVVRYDPQSLTSAQKAQARENIGIDEVLGDIETLLAAI